MMKNLLMFLAVFALAVTLIGCNQGDDSYKKVLAKGELVIGLDESYPPMGFRDKDGNIVGFDIDLATEVCSRIGVKLKAKPILWNAKEQELNSGNIDCIWNGMSVDSVRASTMNLSAPYLTNHMGFVVVDSAKAVMDSLKGKKIAVQSGSTALRFLEASEVGKSAPEIITFDDNLTALANLENGAVDAVYLDKVIAKYWILKNDKPYVYLEDRPTNEVLAIGFRKEDQALRDAVNDILTAMKKDGRFVEISAKWFGR